MNDYNAATMHIFIRLIQNQMKKQKGWGQYANNTIWNEIEIEIEI